MTIATSPLVSVIIPVFNRAPVLRRALDTVLAQSYPQFEVIVVDDGSEDNPAQVVESCQDPRVSLYRLPLNSGAAAARNAGVGHARGELIAFLDSDDEWFKDKLARQVDYLKTHPEQQATCTGYELHRLNSRSGVKRTLRQSELCLPGLLDICGMSPGTTLMVWKGAWDENGGFSPDLIRFEDWDWLLRFVERFEIGAVPEILATVNVGRHPQPELVRAAAQCLEARQEDRVRRLTGSNGVRRFTASLTIEVAVAEWRAGRHSKALGELVRGTCRSPTRMLSLSSRLIRKNFAGDGDENTNQ